MMFVLHFDANSVAEKRMRPIKLNKDVSLATFDAPRRPNRRVHRHVTGAIQEGVGSRLGDYLSHCFMFFRLALTGTVAIVDEMTTNAVRVANKHLAIALGAGDTATVLHVSRRHR
jgi:hypothetical protein